MSDPEQARASERATRSESARERAQGRGRHTRSESQSVETVVVGGIDHDKWGGENKSILATGHEREERRELREKVV